jgi:hypothetical protein
MSVREEQRKARESLKKNRKIEKNELLSKKSLYLLIWVK